MSKNEEYDLRHWVIDDVALIGEQVGGLKAPSQMVGLLLDGYSTDDGKNFERVPFAANLHDGTIMLLSKEHGENVFEKLKNFLNHPRGIAANLIEENEAAVALWEVGQDKVALLVLDSTSRTLQDKFEGYLNGMNISLVSSPDSATVLRFDADRIVKNKEDVMGPDLELFLENNLYVVPAPEFKVEKKVSPASQPVQSAFSFKP